MLSCIGRRWINYCFLGISLPWWWWFAMHISVLFHLYALHVPFSALHSYISRLAFVEIDDLA